jgi:hypothetical protein
MTNLKDKKFNTDWIYTPLMIFAFSLCFIPTCQDSKRPSVTLSPSDYWKARPNATGLHWYNASDLQKLWICKRMKKRNLTSDELWDFFDEWFITNGRPDPHFKKATLESALKEANKN